MACRQPCHTVRSSRTRRSRARRCWPQSQSSCRAALAPASLIEVRGWRTPRRAPPPSLARPATRQPAKCWPSTFRCPRSREHDLRRCLPCPPAATSPPREASPTPSPNASQAVAPTARAANKGKRRGSRPRPQPARATRMLSGWR
eukprot:7275394-Prymnesium_polylepis.1